MLSGVIGGMSRIFPAFSDVQREDKKHNLFSGSPFRLLSRHQYQRFPFWY
jgi:hypothetical protein